MGSDELERGTGGQGWVWRLTGRGLVGGEREWGVGRGFSNFIPNLESLVSKLR